MAFASSEEQGKPFSRVKFNAIPGWNPKIKRQKQLRTVRMKVATLDNLNHDSNILLYNYDMIIT